MRSRAENLQPEKKCSKVVPGKNCWQLCLGKKKINEVGGNCAWKKEGHVCFFRTPIATNFKVALFFGPKDPSNRNQLDLLLV